MWIMTTGGFVSAVQHRDNPELVMVRGRDRQSLDTMLQSIAVGDENFDIAAHEVTTVPKSDYRWRVTITKDQLVAFTTTEIKSYLTYDNFKNEVTKTIGKRWHDVFLSVWTVMRRIQDQPVKPAEPDFDEPADAELLHFDSVLDQWIPQHDPLDDWDDELDLANREIGSLSEKEWERYLEEVEGRA